MRRNSDTDPFFLSFSSFGTSVGASSAFPDAVYRHAQWHAAVPLLARILRMP